jgi:ribose transport system ATP-binding protein
MVEIATALDRDCKILILDEPTAALSAAETKTLFSWLDTLREQGVGIIYISHRLDEVSRIADRVTVLRDGKYVCTKNASELTTDEMVGLMSGDANSPSQHQHHSFATETIAIRVERLSRPPSVVDVSFDVHRGERFGIAGLVGSGRTELLRLMFGADVAASGHLFLRDETTPHRFRHPSQAVAAGLAMITEDRKQSGLLLPQSIRVNTSLCSMQTLFSAFGFICERDEQRSARELCDSMETRCTSTEQSVGTLSGGNQQKVAISKWLLRDANVFLFDEPTRGIDVAARHRIYRLMDTLARDGKAIIVVSSDLEELLETCDRIAVMSAGRLVRTFVRNHWSHDEIMQAAFSGYVGSRSA